MKPAALALLCLPLAGCGLFFSDDDDGADGGVHPADADPSEPDAAPRPDGRPYPDGGPCNPVVTAFAPIASPHVTEGMPVTYPTNPPSSGPHYPKWAKWRRTYGPGTLVRPYWVHNLEHGGVVFLFNCPQEGGCPDVVASLEALQTSLGKDPKCPDARPTRTIIVADAELPEGVQVAAAAWGASYTATCFDEVSLHSFYDDHFGRAPEDFCTEGQVP